MARRKRVASEREMEKQVEEFVTKGYKIQERGQYSTKVKEKDFGSPPVHAFTFLFSLLGAAILFGTVGLPSGGAWVFAIAAVLAYTAYSWFTAEEVIISVEQDAQGTGSGDGSVDAAADATREAAE